MSDKYSFFLTPWNRKVLIHLWVFVFCFTLSPVFPSKAFLFQSWNFIPSFSEWYHQSQYHIDSSVMQIDIIALLIPVQHSCHNVNTANVQCLQRPFPDRNPLLMLFLVGCWRLFHGFRVTGYQYLVSPVGWSRDVSFSENTNGVDNQLLHQLKLHGRNLRLLPMVNQQVVKVGCVVV